ncbi:acetyl-CoA carboxylase biotin carboxyl carrier protein [Pelobacter propionicus]|uniref:Biotin carboxyl carrier protein of acetyl-CoA carboxylase n=1 Tax=Pelobacter propionicus (strain DSM 2379 / NBRC 103807 / OttBd1) TaxID=338966 RepID=A1AQL1_PELPD|nr:acetyl-CoA carboxylase biotin carboxyl carrier protein [Pelobacter propionicus]ABK99631.1 biotin carboxyl carrier protein [Pelobacter propionicus DSM 2379]
MDVKDLQVLFDMITETDITEFEMENSDEKIVIRRGARVEQLSMVPVPAPQAAVQCASAPAEAPASAAAPTAAQGDTINSPIVGTFYCAPEPGAASYVEPGQVVEKGQMLCIVEAMKLMNEIEAEFRCRILKVCKENGQAVEFGDPLFVIEKM